MNQAEAYDRFADWNRTVANDTRQARYWEKRARRARRQGGQTMQIWMEVERFDGATIETRSVSGTEDECEEFVLALANAFGTVHVLDSRGKRVRTVTPGEAAELLRRMPAVDDNGETEESYADSDYRSGITEEGQR